MTNQAAQTPVSILVLTLNESANIEACLQSVAGFDDVTVLDSVSTDGTQDLARTLGANVVERRFDNWAAHQNWAMEHVPFRQPWVFYLDADERMTPELQAEIAAIAADRTRPEVAYYCGRRNWFMGTWIRHAMPPGMIMRFFQPGHVRFERLVNPVPVIDGPHGYLRNLFEHYNFSKGLSEWIAKHNTYSQFEAMEGMKLLAGAPPSLRRLLGRDAFDRRKALKELSFRMPLRPLAKFLWMYVLKRGFLDGRAGFTYCRQQAMYEYMIVVKMAELRRKARGLPT
ncbi:MAG: glycosyltransferase family 2 protein [Phycisphaerales bacterium]